MNMRRKFKVNEFMHYMLKKIVWCISLNKYILLKTRNKKIHWYTLKELRLKNKNFHQEKERQAAKCNKNKRPNKYQNKRRELTTLTRKLRTKKKKKN